MATLSVGELNAMWAAERLPFRLDRRGVAHLWAVYDVNGDTKPPLLFIIGIESHAVAQALRWSVAAHGSQGASVAA